MAIGDIDEVEREIEALSGRVRAIWTPVARKAAADLERSLQDALRRGRLREKESRDRTGAAVVLVLLGRLLLTEREQVRGARASARRILLAASTRTSVALGSRLPAPAVIRRTSEGLARSLPLLSAGRAESRPLRTRVEALTREWIETPYVRLPAAAAKALREVAADLGTISPSLAASLDAVGVSYVHRAGEAITPALAESVRKWQEGRREDGSLPSVDVEDWRRDLEAAIVDPRGTDSTVITDAWAYRANSIGVFLAAKEAKVDVLVAQNPLDERTTDFCRWVHGKVIKVDRVEALVTRFLEAAKEGEPDNVVEAWPLFRTSQKALREAKARIQGSTERAVSNSEVFRRFFARVGLPPYHWRCRTVPVPRLFVVPVPPQVETVRAG